MNSGYLDDATKAFREAAAAFGEIVDRPEVGEAWAKPSALESESGDRLLDLRPTVPIVVRLGDWLPTRFLELVVHGDDLSASVGIHVPPPPEAAAMAIDVMVAVARAVHGDLAVIRALARRERATAVFPIFEQVRAITGTRTGRRSPARSRGVRR